MKPDDKPMLQGIAKNWERHWEKGPRTSATLLPEHLEMVSKHYLIWMTAESASVRSEARRAERGGRVCDMRSSLVAGSSTSDVKDRLGPKRVPVWDRLEKLPPPRIDSDTTGKRKRYVGIVNEDGKKVKGKEKVIETRRKKKRKGKEPREEVAENEIEE